MKKIGFLLIVLFGLGNFVSMSPVIAESPTPNPTATYQPCKVCGEEPLVPTPTLVTGPVVHFWFFFDSGCYGCLKVYNSILPRILANYVPGQVVMHTWDVTQGRAGVKRVLEQQYGIVDGDATEIFIGEDALRGSQEIETRLPQLIDQYLTRGGVALIQPSVTTQPMVTLTPMRSPSPLLTTSVQTTVVRVVLFWSNTCPHCHEVIDNVLPPLQNKYGSRLDIRMFELSDPANMQLFKAALEALHVPSDQGGVPLMIVGDQILVGSLDIPQQLPGLIEKHLAAGGIGWPQIPGFEKLVGAGFAQTPVATSTPVVRVIVNDTPVPSTSVAIVPSKPVVRTVMFWMNGCPHCEEVMTRVLPPLQQKYGAQLDIRLVEVVSTQDVDELYKLGATFGLLKEQTGVPFLIIGNRALVGSTQIPAELPALIEQHLAAGGVDWPTITGLTAERIPTPASSSPICLPTVPDCGTETVKELPVQTILRQDPAGFALTIVVMLGMIGALARVGLDALTRRQRSSVSSSAWKTWAVPFLVVLGLGVAGYLAYVELFQVSAICGPVGHCNTVQQSPYARLFGILPIGVLGMLGYLAILGAWFICLIGRTEIVALARRTAFAFAVCGVLFSLYLTLLEPFVIGAVCAWCLTSAVIMTALMLLLTRPALQAPRMERA